MLAEVPTVPWRELLRHWPDGRVKLRVTRELLRVRRDRAAVFQRGNYQPIQPTGRFADRLVVFVRKYQRESVLVIIPRMTSLLGSPPLGLVWEDTGVPLPSGQGTWCDVLTGKQWALEGKLAVSELFQELPLAVLYRG
jgi:(1->4)-alpha-D-glucan 1-alpha-D-glucosylmutase